MVVGLDVGGTKTNATLLDSKGVFLNNRMVETPSRVLEGPEAAIEAMAKAIELAVGGAGVHGESVRVIGLDTPGPASANGVISSKGGTNFSGKEWWGFDIRTAVEDFFKLPVVYNNDANAAALYAISASSAKIRCATRRCRQSSVPASAAALSTTVASFAALAAWQVSWVIFEFLWKICCRTINRSRNATVVFTAIWKALRR